MSRWRAFRQGTDRGVSDWCFGDVRFDRVRAWGDCGCVLRPERLTGRSDPRPNY